MAENTEPVTIIRAEHNKDNPYVIMDKRIFENNALSWKAKGLLGYLLSRPDDWRIIMADLVKRSADGQHAVRSAIRELEQLGYIKQERRHNKETGYFEWVYVVYESPSSGFPYMDNPSMDNQTLLNNDSTNNESTNNSNSSNEELSAPEQPELLQVDDLETIEVSTKEDELLFAMINQERRAKHRRALSAKFQSVAQKKAWRTVVGKAQKKYNGSHTTELQRLITGAMAKGITDRGRLIAYIGGAFKDVRDKGEEVIGW